MIQYIAYIWRYGDLIAMLSRESEDFKSFKKRVESCYPIPEWHHKFSEFKEIY